MFSSEKIITIIQARMNSTRLPGKVLLNWNGSPMLQCLLERVITSRRSSKVIVATTETHSDDRIEALCMDIGVPCFRGSEHDVLDRFVQASLTHEAAITVRLTADNPFVNGELVDYAIDFFLSDYPKIDYLSNTDNKQFPYGLFVEVIKTSTLMDINKAAGPEEAEHVTLKIRNNPNEFNIKSLPSDRDYPNLSLTVDTYEDALTLMPLFNSLKVINPHFGLSEIANINI